MVVSEQGRNQKVKAVLIKADPSRPLSNIVNTARKEGSFGEYQGLKSVDSLVSKSTVSKAVTNIDVIDTIPASVGDNDPNSSYSTLLEPLYDMNFLGQIAEYNNMVGQCIDAYKTNIVGYGYGPSYNVDVESKLFKKSKNEIDNQWDRLKFLYDNCNFQETFTELMEKVISDRETSGIGYLEVIDSLKGGPMSFVHLRNYNIRMTTLGEPVKVSTKVLGPGGVIKELSYIVKFRKYCQTNATSTMWFKEYGDPRKMDKITGEYEGEQPIPRERLATSILSFSIYSSYTPYGLPRYLGNILSMLGSRKAEELNYNYFYNGKHIPMAIIISNGSLTESSIEKLEEYATSMKGVDNAYGYLVLEAAGFEDDDNFGEASPQGVKIEMKSLTEVIQDDGLFQKYDDNNRNKVRSAFRLPPLYTGESSDYTRSTADTARQVAEEQIFSPERKKLAAKFNKLINNKLGVYYVDMEFKGPSLSNKLNIATAAKAYIEGGAATPNMLVDSLGDLVDKRLEQLPEWGNVPMKVLIELVKQDKIELPELKKFYKEPDAKEGGKLEGSNKNDGLANKGAQEPGGNGGENNAGD